MEFGKKAKMPYYGANGHAETEFFIEDVYSMRQIAYDADDYQLQFEVKTLRPIQSGDKKQGKTIRQNIRALRYGMKQVTNRLDASDADNPYGYLVTDMQSYMDIVNSANNGGKAAKKFIEEMEDFVDKGGNRRLWLVKGLWSDANDLKDSIKEDIQNESKRANF